MAKREYDNAFPCADLKKHKNNHYLYQDLPDEEFLESVRRSGIRTPLLVCAKTKTIISGHKRHKAAQDLGIEFVPVKFEHGLYEDELLMLLVDANKQRVRNNEMATREAALINSAEGKRRYRLKLAAARAGSSEPVFEEPVIEVTANETGMTPRMVKRAITVSNALDVAEAAGDTDQVEKIKQAVNHSITHGAAVAISSPAKPKKKKKRANRANVDRAANIKLMQDLTVLAGALRSGYITLEKDCGGPGHHSRSTLKALSKHDEKAQDWADDLK